MKTKIATALTTCSLLLLPLACQQDQKAERIEEQAEQKAEQLEERAEQIEERGEERADIVEERDELQGDRQPVQQEYNDQGEVTDEEVIGQ